MGDLPMSRYFLGWYFKCQSEQETIAVIPALHKANGEKILFHPAHYPPRLLEPLLPRCALSPAEIGDYNRGKPLFRRRDRAALTRRGPACGGLPSLRPLFSPPIRHHGSVLLPAFYGVPPQHPQYAAHGQRGAADQRCSYLFQNAVGYLEGDRGRSFPRAYIWTQCCFPEGSLVLCVAEIPLAGFRFTGVIGVVLWRGREYRLATYLGARAVTIEAAPSRCSRAPCA